MKHIQVNDYASYKDLMKEAWSDKSIIYFHKLFEKVFTDKNKLDMNTITSEEELDEAIQKYKRMCSTMTIIESSDIKRFNEFERMYKDQDGVCIYCGCEMISVDDVNDQTYQATIYQCPLCMTKKVKGKFDDVLFENLPKKINSQQMVSKKDDII